MQGNKIKKILLGVFGLVSVVFLVLSISSLYAETEVMNTSFITPWFTWQVDATAVYLLTAVLCLVTAKIAMEIYCKKESDLYEVLIEG